MTARPTPLPTAAQWKSRLENAIRRQVAAERYANGALLDARLDPSDPFAEELRNARRAAVLAEAEAWEQYARRCADAMDSAAQAERRGRYEDGAA